MEKKVFFIGIDSATWDLIKPWVEESKLPGFAQLLNNGDNFDMMSTIPPFTPSAWTTMFTGLSPAEHGIYDFTKLNSDQSTSLATTEHINDKYCWSKLSKLGKKVCVYNIPMTYPVHKVNGLMVTSFTAPELDAYPKSLIGDIKKKFKGYSLSANGKFDPHNIENTRKYVKALKFSIKQKLKLSDWLFQKDDWDLYIMNVLDIDHAGHFFWKDMSDVDSEFRNVMFEMYQIIDAYISKVIKKHADKYVIMVASDHGMQYAREMCYINVWLERNGYLHFKKDPKTRIKKALRSTLLNPRFLMYVSSKLNLTKAIRKANRNTENRVVRQVFLSIEDVDMEKTTAFALGEYNGIYVRNVKDKQKHINEIIRKLKIELGDRLTYIDSTEKFYGKKEYPQNLPDIQFLIDDGSTLFTSVYAFAGSKFFDVSVISTNGSHKPNGILSIYNNNSKGTFNSCSIYDVTPTILSLMDDTFVNDYKGKSLVSKRDEIVDDIEL